MDNFSFLKFEKLCGENYLNWNYHMNIFLEAKQLWYVVDGGLGNTPSEEDLVADKSALRIISNSVDDSQISYIRNAATSKDAWVALQKAHTHIRHIHVIHLKREFYASRLIPAQKWLIIFPEFQIQP